MSTTIDVSGADAYFSATTHVMATVWARFSVTQKTAAVAQALRQLARWYGYDLADESVDADTWFQPDYAAYEQALHLLMRSDAIPNGDQSGPKFVSTDLADSAPRARPSGEIAPEAMRWLGTVPGSCRVARG